MKSKIKNIISGYCEGNYHLEFCLDDLDKMVNEIVDVKLAKSSTDIQPVIVCSRENCTDKVYDDSVYCLDHAYQHKMEGY